MLISEEFAIDEENPLGLEGELIFDVSVDYIPGEPPIQYYPDGSGFPGSPPEIQIFDARCVSVSGRPATDDEISRLKEWAMAKADNSKFHEQVIHNFAESQYDK